MSRVLSEIEFLDDTGCVPLRQNAEELAPAADVRNCDLTDLLVIQLESLDDELWEYQSNPLAAVKCDPDGTPRLVQV